MVNLRMDIKELYHLFNSYEEFIYPRIQNDTRLSDKNTNEAWKIDNGTELPQYLTIDLASNDSSDLLELTGIKIDKSNTNIYANKVNLYYSVSVDEPVWIPIDKYRPPNLIKPLNMFSNNYGTDLEIKIEWDNLFNGSNGNYDLTFNDPINTDI